MIEIFDVLTSDIHKVEIDPAGLPVTAYISDTDPDNQWQNLVDLTASAPAGKYEVTISMVWNYDSNKRSGLFKWTIDGGTTWLETSEEPKDKTDDRPFSVSFPVDHSGGERNIKVEASRESNSYDMTMYYCAVIYKRIG